MVGGDDEEDAAADACSVSSRGSTSTVGWACCPVCERQFSSEFAMERHIIIEHVHAPTQTQCRTLQQRRRFRCNRCPDFECGTMSKLKNHWYVTHVSDAVKTRTCVICGYRAASHDKLRCHVTLVHTQLLVNDRHVTTAEDEGRKYKCKWSRCRFSSRVNLEVRKHEEEVHGVIFRYNCDQCDYRTMKRSQFLRHQSTHNPKTRERFQCNFCDYMCRCKDALKRHVMYKHESSHRLRLKPLACSLCSYRTVEKKNLTLHLMKHYKDTHGDYGLKGQQWNINRGMCGRRKLFQCDKCEKQLSSNAQLKEHFVRHTGVKNFACDQCKFKAYSVNDLRKHVKRHSTDPHKCEYCKYETHEKRHLERHMQRHVVRKELPAAAVRELCKYSCDKCQYKCVTKCRLQQHVCRKHRGAAVQTPHGRRRRIK